MTTTRGASATLDKFIWRKDGARHLWFRMAVPRRYHAVEQRRIIQRDLKTNDGRQASVVAGGIRADLHREWDSRLLQTGNAALPPFESSPSIEPTLLDLQIDAAEVGYVKTTARLNTLYERRGIADSEAYQRHLDNLAYNLLRLVRTRDDDTNLMWRRYADSRILKNNWLLPMRSPLYDQFVTMIADAGIEAIRIEIERRKGNRGAAPTSGVVVEALQAQKHRAAHGETITELFEKYAAQRIAAKRKRADTVNQDRKIVQLFADFVGANRSMRSITPADIRDWRDTLTAIPPVYRKRKEFDGVPLRQVAQKAKAMDLTGMGPVTVNKYLSTVSPLFTWCRRENYADHNPCDGLFFDIIKGSNPRPPYTTEQLNRILQSPLFNGFERDGREYNSGDQRATDWRFWIPLICLFTGARIGEIAQLRIDDIYQEHGAWCIHIRSDETTGQRTKANVSRVTTLHSKLRAMGLIGYLEGQRKRAEGDGNQQLFPAMVPNKRDQIGALPSRFWRNYLSRIGVKCGADGIGAHSFRHTLADQLRAADYLDSQVAVAIGHNQKTVTSGYGRIKQGTVNLIGSMIEAIKFEGVSFDHLIPIKIAS